MCLFMFIRWIWCQGVPLLERFPMRCRQTIIQLDHVCAMSEVNQIGGARTLQIPAITCLSCEGAVCPTAPLVQQPWGETIGSW